MGHETMFGFMDGFMAGFMVIGRELFYGWVRALGWLVAFWTPSHDTKTVKEEQEVETEEEEEDENEDEGEIRRKSEENIKKKGKGSKGKKSAMEQIKEEQDEFD